MLSTTLEAFKPSGHFQSMFFRGTEILESEVPLNAVS